MFQKVGNFFTETFQELKKVTWPIKGEVWQSTVVVAIATAIVALLIFVVDFVLTILTKILFG